jgi:leucyl-tRNA synthetase
MTHTQSSHERYDPAVVEASWQRRWRERQTNATDLSGAVRPYYNLMMFPYPSAEGLHVGNVFAFVGADVHGRFRRLQGWDVFEPIGFDAFGIHSENYALKVNTHPAELIPRNIARFREQLTRVGLMLDWDHEVQTTDPRYYKWTQWIFLKLFEAGLAVKKKAPVNWCPECKTVLANEQVIDGRCERHPDTPVTQRFLEQWFFRITAFTERLLENLQRIDWSESTRLMQTNWIGRSEGAELVFRTEHGTPIEVFTTRPDTVFGATYMVLAPEHPLVQVLTTDAQREEVEAYRRHAAAMDVVTRRVGEKEKTGVFTGASCRNPATGEQVPVWIADGVRHRSHHGGACARRARLRLRAHVRTADSAGGPAVRWDACRRARATTGCAAALHWVGGDARQFGTVRRHDADGRGPGDHGVARVAGRWEEAGAIPPP